MGPLLLRGHRVSARQKCENRTLAKPRRTGAERAGDVKARALDFGSFFMAPELQESLVGMHALLAK